MAEHTFVIDKGYDILLGARINDMDQHVGISMRDRVMEISSIVGYPKADVAKFCIEVLGVLQPEALKTPVEAELKQ